ncbi:threonine dehydratase [Nakamurella panacisegetis]|uniref:L-threonine dehydratase catabolic TdcB n=1 Tax=Nakamurella panacisegetis TaxID=1090615 RepID=A0A1H0IFJ0_9ACTN|nr:threonine ammonia-lyase [Nakamurella panacisegetis]SDO30184.1 threonine dehydratase [Nakamurella panacisegetis]
MTEPVLSAAEVRMIGVEEIQEAAALLEGVIRYTPMESSRPLNLLVGGPVYLKCENLQRTGSFKIRGAYTRISRLTDAERANGVVAASAGNHAQGVALAAALLGCQATVYMPVGASIAKLSATRAYGATVHLHGETLDESLIEARAFAARTGAVLVHPFDHPDILRGQGTVGLEILEQVPDVATIVVAAGGGGLISGIAAAVKATRPDVKIVGVQAEQAAAWPGSLAAGHPVRLMKMSTLADGIAVGEPTALTYTHVSELVDDVVTVSEDQLSRAMLLCLERAKLVVEPAGVAAVAAIMATPEMFTPPVVAVLSGGNIDPLVLLHVTQHGLVAAGRFLSLRIEISDRPGSLARLLALVGELGASVVDVEQSRLGSSLALGDVEVDLRLECRGPSHRDELLERLAEARYRVIDHR